MSAQPVPLPIGYVGYWTDDGGVVHRTRELAPGESRMVFELMVVCGATVALLEDCAESAVPTCLWCVGYADRRAVRDFDGHVIRRA